MSNATAKPARATQSIPQASRRLGISPGTGYELAARGEFPVRVIRAGKRILVPTAEIDRALGLTPDEGHRYEAAV